MTCTTLSVEVESGPLINCLPRVQPLVEQPSPTKQLRFQSELCILRRGFFILGGGGVYFFKTILKHNIMETQTNTQHLDTLGSYRKNKNILKASLIDNPLILRMHLGKSLKLRTLSDLTPQFPSLVSFPWPAQPSAQSEKTSDGSFSGKNQYF